MKTCLFRVYPILRHAHTVMPVEQPTLPIKSSRNLIKLFLRKKELKKGVKMVECFLVDKTCSRFE